MLLLSCCPNQVNSIQEYLTIGLSVFAAIIAIGYFFRPRLYYCVYKKEPGNLNQRRQIQRRLQQNRFNYCIKVENMNLSRNTIKEVKCEVAISRHQDFNQNRTVEPQKSEILFLKSVRRCGGNRLFNYVFWFEEDAIPYGYNYLRVRLLAYNALGIRKHYERYYLLDQIHENEATKTQCQCWHNIKTNKNSFGFIKPGIRCKSGAYIEKLLDRR